MNDNYFSNSFRFRKFHFNNYNHSDNSNGINCHYFAYMISGRCKIVTESRTVEIKENDLFYIPYGCKYHSYWHGEPYIDFISLSFVFLPNYTGNTYPVQVVSNCGEVYDIMKLLCDDDILTAKKIGDFYSMLGVILPNMVSIPVSKNYETVNMVKTEMLNNPHQKISDIAKKCAVSTSAIYTAFKASSTMTPNQLKNSILNEEAKKLLISTDDTIEYISNSLGFSSVSYFRKSFKEQFKMTPKQVRKKYRI